jgi:uncharacterized membrane protein YfcA
MWPCAAAFAIAGVLGAAVGSTLGKALDGGKLLFLCAFVMFVLGSAMLRPRTGEGDRGVRLDPTIASWELPYASRIRPSDECTDESVSFDG